jgi:uncharacterized membrane protein YfcA
MFELTPDILLLLAATGLIAGTIDAIAGGGGLITIPVLMTVGIPPHYVLGTNKFQSACGTAMAVSRYAKHDLINWEEIKPAVIGAFLGSVFGTLLVQQLDGELLKPVVPFVLMGMAIYFLKSKRFSDADSHARVSMLTFACTFAALIGFYDGFFGPGAGSFYTAALVAFLGFNLRKATANTKLLNLMSNLGSLLMFLFQGQIVWEVALVMAVAQLIGGALGARLVLRHGTQLVKPLLASVAIILSIKLLWQQLVVNF